MNRPRVYVETSIPSFHFERRSDPESVARRRWTRAWWEGANERYEVVSSAAVLGELGAGEYPGKEECLAFIHGVPLLPIVPEIIEIVDTYVRRHVMPGDPRGDALHLAVASYHKCDFLLTWNCRHLANANKFGHIRRVNTLLGLFVPALVTPLELLGGANDAGKAGEDRAE